jgi:hypothetical protein
MRIDEKKVRQTDKKNIAFIVIFFIIVCAIAQIQTQNLPVTATEEWVAHPLYISPFGGSQTPIGYFPSQIRTAYNLPATGGDGATIAIVDAYDTPNILSYFNTFSNRFGLPNNSTGNFLVHKMSQNMQADSDWALETCLDVEWAHAIAPNAKIILVEAVSPSTSALLSAIDYATNQPGVVAVSMSWGNDEFSFEDKFDNHFNKPGIAFFASSGDDGKNVIWPAASANVISIGGTTLNLNADGAVLSEVAWRNSSGGISRYLARPIYQTNFGLTYTNRSVPDVSYNGNASTGVAVYNGTWWKIGGTSAGAPQWAAIHALGLSVSNTNLYYRAKLAYSSYFRDINEGANYYTSASTGYDLVTGLGSPLTTDFSTEVTITPTEGPPNGPVTLNGVGFALGSSVNISYKNPLTSSWIPLSNNFTITTDPFSYPLIAPDLMQNNTAGDTQPKFENIFFKVVDNNNRSFITTESYTEWRRGISQIGNLTATGLYGNGTNLATSLLIQNSGSIPIAGRWFTPGNLSIYWDNTKKLGVIVTDDTGSFYTTITVPSTLAGQHTLTLNDGTTNFCLILTRMPSIANDYLDVWHTSNFDIILTPDFAVTEIFYRINDGPVKSVTADGQPAIITEGSNNKLEYWCTWDLYGTGIVDLPHITLTNIKLDKTAPTGSVTSASANVNILTVTLDLNATDEFSVEQMRFSNGNSDWSGWEQYTTSKTWVLTEGNGLKTVNVQFMDSAGLISPVYSCTINLAMPTPTPHPTVSQTTKPAIIISPTIAPSLDPTNSPTIQPTPISTVPESNIETVIVLLCTCTLMLALIYKRNVTRRRLDSDYKEPVF